MACVSPSSPASGTKTPRPSTPPDEPGLEESRRSPWGLVGRVAIVVLVLGIIAMWGYAFFGEPYVPGRLGDTSFPTAAQPVCDATMVKIQALPRANETPNASDRAAVVDRGTTYLDEMIGDLRTRIPAAQPEGEAVRQWLDDWAIYVNDRREYTAALRVDPLTRFAVTQSPRDNTQITKAVDRFATINKMPACATPDDVS